MSYKPDDFFVGVVDFFAVLLPGAVVVAVGRPFLPETLYGAAGVLRPVTGTTASWVLFLLAAYLAGHLLFLLGAFLDSTLYDPLRSVTVPPGKDRAYEAARAAQNQALGGSSHVMNTFQWARATLRLQAPPAMAEIERYEADSKFFRSLTVALYALVFLFLDRESRIIAAALPAGLAAGHGMRVLLKRLHGESGSVTKTWTPRLMKLAVGFAAATWVVLLARAVSSGNTPAVPLIVLLALSIWRYAERRWKSTRAAYYYVVVSRSLPRPARKKTAQRA
ncbi:MAG TPA: hypothetical protein VFZ24_07745 [Longimicrobiales bacterium]